MIFDSSKKDSFQAICRSYNPFNKISVEIMHYKAADAKLTRESLQHQSKEAMLMRKSISVEANAASLIEKW